MFIRIKRSIELALILTMFTSFTVLAKGGFAFITVTGTDMIDPIRITDTGLTGGFFVFANFYEDKAEAPVNPGEGYEITRYYVDSKRETAFDHLHYYPDIGYVFYDGIVNGSSEYDGKWYKAAPNIRSVFEAALLTQTQPAKIFPQSQPVEATGQSNASITQNQPVMIIASVAGLILALVLAYQLRKPVTQ